MEKLTISFFGHRRIPYGIDLDERLKETIQNCYDRGGRIFKMGNHGEFDGAARSACCNFKRNNKDIKVVVTLTSLALLNRPEDESSVADFYTEQGAETIMYEIEEIHFKNQITFSNRRMVDESDIIVCYINPKNRGSGAGRAVRYAQRQGKEVVNLFKPQDDPSYGKTKEQLDQEFKEYIEQIKKENKIAAEKKRIAEIEKENRKKAKKSAKN